MSKPGPWYPFRSFKRGQMSDLPAHLIPDDGMLLGENVIMNKVGRVSKRGPVSSYVSNGGTINIDQVGITKLNIGNTNPLVIGVSATDQAFYPMPLSNGTRQASVIAPTSSSYLKFDAANRDIDLTPSASPSFAPSFNSFGLTAFPLSSSTLNKTTPFVFFSNASALSSVQNTTGICILDAGKASIVVPAAVFSNVEVGSFIYISNWSGAGVTTNEYIGYVTAKNGSTLLDVYPPPSKSFTTTATGKIMTGIYQSIIRNIASPSGNTTLCETGGGIIPQSATFGCVHQNRVVLAVTAENTVDQAGTLFTYQQTKNNVVSWSATTGESDSAANVFADGILPLLQAGWPKSQRITLDTAKVVALVSMDANNLMVLCSDKIVMISGKLGTVVPTAGINENSVSIRTISADIGCIDADSVQRTASGIMFAARNGVYVTDGTTFTNVMENKIQNDWGVYEGGKGNSIVGSCVIGDTHYVVFTLKGPHYVCDMTNDFSWSLITFNDDQDGTSNIAFESTSVLPTRATANSITAPKLSGDGSKVILSSWGLGGSLAIASVALGGATNITGVLTDTGTAFGSSRDIGVDFNASRVAQVVRDTTTGIYSARVYTISGTTATLESVLNPPVGRTFALTLRCDMNSAGNVVVVSLVNGFAVYERTGTTWTNTATFTDFTGFTNTVVVSSDGTTIACSRYGADINVNMYRKSGGVWNPMANSISFATGLTTSDSHRFTSISKNGETVAVLNGVSAWVWFWSPTTSSWSAKSTPVTNASETLNSMAISERSNLVTTWYFNTGFTAGTGYTTLRKSSNEDGNYNRSISYYSGALSSFAYSVADFSDFNIATGTILCISDRMDTTSARVSFSPITPGRASYFSYGVGVRDPTGASEVYAPRVSGKAIYTRYDPVVLLDSILTTDKQIVTSVPAFNQLVDASALTAYNATIQTKSYALGDVSSLKSYKTLMFTYDADAKADTSDPVDVWSAEGLEPTFDLTLAPKYTADATPSPTPSIPATKTTRYSIYPRAIDAGIAFAFKTDYIAADSAAGYGRFQLYDLTLNVNELRKGRTVQ